MAHSHNDQHLFGNNYRTKTVTHGTVYESKVKIINPETNKPFTNQGLETTLQNCIQENPSSEEQLKPYLSGIKKKAAEHPDAEFCLSRRGEDKASAKKELENLHMAEIQVLMRVMFSKSYRETIATGDITLSAFVSYVAPFLLSKEDTWSDYVNVLRRYVLPVIGRIKLKHMTTKMEQENLCKKIVEHLNMRVISPRIYSLVGKAYIALLLQAVSFHVHLDYEPFYVVHKFFVKGAQPDNNRKAFRMNHFDEDQRRKLFGVIARQEYPDFALLIVLLLYCGLNSNEIPALHYGNLQSHTYNGTHFYSIFVDRRMHHVTKKISVQRAYDDRFSFPNLRSVVLSPWVCHVLERRKDCFRSLDRTDDEINTMPLSTVKPNKVLNPDDLKKC